MRFSVNMYDLWYVFLFTLSIVLSRSLSPQTNPRPSTYHKNNEPDELPIVGVSYNILMRSSN